MKGLKGECLVLKVETDINNINWTNSGKPAFVAIMTSAGQEYFVSPNQIEKVLS